MERMPSLQLNSERAVYENRSEQEVLDAPGRFKIGYKDLPPEIIFRIFRYLSPNDQGAATCVCRNWRDVGEDIRLRAPPGCNIKSAKR